MNEQAKTQELLLKELQELRQKYDALQVSCKQNIPERNSGEDVLLESEENFRSIFENSSAAMALLEPDTTISLVNEEFCRISGYTKQEVIGTSWTQKIPTEDLERLKEFNCRRLINPKDVPDKYESSFYYKSGEIGHSMMSVTLLSNRKTIVSFYDITDRKKAEESLLQAQSLMSALMDNVPTHIYFKDLKSRFIRNNKAHAQSLGLSDPNQMVGKSDFDFFPEEFAQRAYEDEQEIIRVGQAINKEEVLKRSDGVISWFWVTKMPLRNNEGNIVGTFGVSRDITRTKQAEQQLKEKEERYRAVTYTANDAIITADDKGVIIDWNKGAEQIFGYTKTEIENNNPFLINLVPEKYRYGHSNGLRRLQAGGESRVIGKTVELEGLHKGGLEFPIELSLAQWETSEGLFFTAIIRDITERKRKEAEIKLKNEQLHTANAEKDKFFSIIAHDLRSPFKGFLGLTDIMTEELRKMSLEEIQEMITMMKESASNLYRLLENLLEWAQMQRGTIAFNPTSLFLKPKIIENLATVQDSAVKKSITIICDIPEDLMVYADQFMLGGILRNIASNALKFTPKGGKVTISAQLVMDNSVEISIRDTGIGMKKELIKNLFRIDVKSNRLGTEGEPSSGLGLIICKELVEKQGGKLWVESEEMKGCTFYFTLPCQKDIAPKEIIG